MLEQNINISYIIYYILIISKQKFNYNCIYFNFLLMSVQNKYNNCYFKIIKKKTKLISFRKLRENEYKRYRKCACNSMKKIRVK